MIATRPYFSIIVPTYNRCLLLPDVVAALRKQDYPDDRYEIIIADNGSTDDTAPTVFRLRELPGAEIHYLYEPRRGSHFARNSGFKRGAGEVLALIDDDIIVDGTWLSTLAAPYADPAVGSVGGRIAIQWLKGDPPSWIDRYVSVLGQLDYGPGAKEVLHLNAGNFSIRRSVLFEVGGYNPCNAPGDYLIGDGESGLCRKVRRAGWRIVFTHDALAWHLVDVSKLNREYMGRRFRTQGVSDVYTSFQASRHGLWMLQALVAVLRFIHRAFPVNTRAATDIEAAILFRELRLAYSKAQLRHYWRLALDAELRSFTRREDWLSEAEP